MEEKKTNTNQTNPNQKVIIVTKEFVGKVTEVHSGDSLTIQSVKFGTTGRFCLTNIKAPAIQKNNYQPYAFEAKEFLRKLLIGKEVKVKMEYEKQFQITRDQYDDVQEKIVEIKEDKSLIFAMIEFDGKQLATEVIRNGFANLIKPYTEIEQSKIYEELKQAEAEAIKKKVGLHKTGEYKPRNFRDLTEKQNQQQAKNVAQLMIDAGKVSGVIELVLNGSRFKIRVNEFNCYLMFVLQGVRCLPNDDNFPGYDVWSNRALNYSKQHVIQRDVTFKISKVDKKGIFQGQLWLEKKEDYAETLLSQGLAVTFGGNVENIYFQLEQEAKSKKQGLWSASNIDLSGVKGNYQDGKKEIIQLNEKKTVQVSEVIDPNEFYVQTYGGNETIDKLYDELSNYDPTNRAKLQLPVKPNTPCLALFDQDGNYYRATIIRDVQNKKDKYLVHFYDYGNYSEVYYDDIRKLSENYLKIPPQAQRCALAYVNTPNKKQDFYENSIEAMMERVWEKKLTAHFVYKSGNTNYVILYPFNKTDINSSVNENILRLGYGKIDQGVSVPQSLEILQKTEDECKEMRKGVWSNDDD